MVDSVLNENYTAFINNENGDLKMEITVQVKSVYGNEHIYPACDQAKLFADLAGTKTMTHHALQTIKKLGYKIRVQTNTPDYI